MVKSKIVQFPSQPCAADKQNALWVIAIDRYFKDTYSCEYSSDHPHWSVKIEASAFQNVAALVEQCRHALGWDVPTSGKEAANR